MRVEAVVSRVEVDRLRDERTLAIQAAKDFKSYGLKGYDDELITALKNAKNSTEIRELNRKARAVAFA